MNHEAVQYGSSGHIVNSEMSIPCTSSNNTRTHTLRQWRKKDILPSNTNNSNTGQQSPNNSPDLQLSKTAPDGTTTAPAAPAPASAALQLLSQGLNTTMGEQQQGQQPGQQQQQQQQQQQAGPIARVAPHNHYPRQSLSEQQVHLYGGVGGGGVGLPPGSGGSGRVIGAGYQQHQQQQLVQQYSGHNISPAEYSYMQYKDPAAAGLHPHHQQSQHLSQQTQLSQQQPAPVKYSEIVEPALPHHGSSSSAVLKPPHLGSVSSKGLLSTKEYHQHLQQQLDVCNNMQQQSNQQYHPPSSGSTMKQFQHHISSYYKHPVVPPPPPPQYHHQRYPTEANNYLADLNKIAPQMAQSIINDPHLRDPQMSAYSFAEQSRGTTYPNQPQQRYYARPSTNNMPTYHQKPSPYGNTSHLHHRAYQKPVVPVPTSDPYRMYQHSKYPMMDTYQGAGAGTRHNMQLNPYALPSKISPTSSYNQQCAAAAQQQYEYAHHYQARHHAATTAAAAMVVPPDPYQHHMKNTYFQHEQQHLQEHLVRESSNSSKSSNSLKQYLENWNDEDLGGGNDAESAQNNLDIDKAMSIKVSRSGDPNENIYVLDSTEIPTESVTQYLHVPQIDKLPDNIKYYPELPKNPYEKQYGTNSMEGILNLTQTHSMKSTPIEYSPPACLRAEELTYPQEYHNERAVKSSFFSLPVIDDSSTDVLRRTRTSPPSTRIEDPVLASTATRDDEESSEIVAAPQVPNSPIDKESSEVVTVPRVSNSPVDEESSPQAPNSPIEEESSDGIALPQVPHSPIDNVRSEKTSPTLGFEAITCGSVIVPNIAVKSRVATPANSTDSEIVPIEDVDRKVDDKDCLVKENQDGGITPKTEELISDKSDNSDVETLHIPKLSDSVIVESTETKSDDRVFDQDLQTETLKVPTEVEVPEPSEAIVESTEQIVSNLDESKITANHETLDLSISNISPMVDETIECKCESVEIPNEDLVPDVEKSVINLTSKIDKEDSQIISEDFALNLSCQDHDFSKETLKEYTDPEVTDKSDSIVAQEEDEMVKVELQEIQESKITEVGKKDDEELSENKDMEPVLPKKVLIIPEDVKNDVKTETNENEKVIEPNEVEISLKVLESTPDEIEVMDCKTEKVIEIEPCEVEGLTLNSVESTHDEMETNKDVLDCHASNDLEDLQQEVIDDKRNDVSIAKSEDIMEEEDGHIEKETKLDIESETEVPILETTNDTFEEGTNDFKEDIVVTDTEVQKEDILEEDKSTPDILDEDREVSELIADVIDYVDSKSLDETNPGIPNADPDIDATSNDNADISSDKIIEDRFAEPIVPQDVSLEDTEIIPHEDEPVPIENIDIPVEDNNPVEEELNVLRILQNNIILQIADELIQINVITTEDRKIISVIALSDCTVVTENNNNQVQIDAEEFEEQENLVVEDNIERQILEDVSDNISIAEPEEIIEDASTTIEDTLEVPELEKAENISLSVDSKDICQDNVADDSIVDKDKVVTSEDVLSSFEEQKQDKTLSPSTKIERMMEEYIAKAESSTTEDISLEVHDVTCISEHSSSKVEDIALNNLETMLEDDIIPVIDFNEASNIQNEIIIGPEESQESINEEILLMTCNNIEFSRDKYIVEEQSKKQTIYCEEEGKDDADMTSEIDEKQGTIQSDDLIVENDVENLSNCQETLTKQLETLEIPDEMKNVEDITVQVKVETENVEDITVQVRVETENVTENKPDEDIEDSNVTSTENVQEETSKIDEIENEGQQNYTDEADVISEAVSEKKDEVFDDKIQLKSTENITEEIDDIEKVNNEIAALKCQPTEDVANIVENKILADENKTILEHERTLETKALVTKASVKQLDIIVDLKEDILVADIQKIDIVQEKVSPLRSTEKTVEVKNRFNRIRTRTYRKCVIDENIDNSSDKNDCEVLEKISAFSESKLESIIDKEVDNPQVSLDNNKAISESQTIIKQDAKPSEKTTEITKIPGVDKLKTKFVIPKKNSTTRSSVTDQQPTKKQKVSFSTIVDEIKDRADAAREKKSIASNLTTILKSKGAKKANVLKRDTRSLSESYPKKVKQVVNNRRHSIACETNKVTSPKKVLTKTVENTNSLGTTKPLVEPIKSIEAIPSNTWKEVIPKPERRLLLQKPLETIIAKISCSKKAKLPITIKLKDTSLIQKKDVDVSSPKQLSISPKKPVISKPVEAAKDASIKKQVVSKPLESPKTPKCLDSPTKVLESPKTPKILDSQKTTRIFNSSKTTEETKSCIEPELTLLKETNSPKKYTKVKVFKTRMNSFDSDFSPKPELKVKTKAELKERIHLDIRDEPVMHIECIITERINQENKDKVLNGSPSKADVLTDKKLVVASPVNDNENKQVSSKIEPAKVELDEENSSSPQTFRERKDSDLSTTEKDEDNNRKRLTLMEYNKRKRKISFCDSPSSFNSIDSSPLQNLNPEPPEVSELEPPACKVPLIEEEDEEDTSIEIATSPINIIDSPGPIKLYSRMESSPKSEDMNEEAPMILSTPTTTPMFPFEDCQPMETIELQLKKYQSPIEAQKQLIGRMLEDLLVTIPIGDSKMKSDQLMRRFLNREQLTNEEMFRVKQIIKFKKAQKDEVFKRRPSDDSRCESIALNLGIKPLESYKKLHFDIASDISIPFTTKSNPNELKPLIDVNDLQKTPSDGLLTSFVNKSASKYKKLNFDIASDISIPCTAHSTAAKQIIDVMGIEKPVLVDEKATRDPRKVNKDVRVDREAENSPRIKQNDGNNVQVEDSSEKALRWLDNTDLYHGIQENPNKLLGIVDDNKEKPLEVQETSAKPSGIQENRDVPLKVQVNLAKSSGVQINVEKLSGIQENSNKLSRIPGILVGTSRVQENAGKPSKIQEDSDTCSRVQLNVEKPTGIQEICEKLPKVQENPVILPSVKSTFDAEPVFKRLQAELLSAQNLNTKLAYQNHKTPEKQMLHKTNDSSRLVNKTPDAKISDKQVPKITRSLDSANVINSNSKTNGNRTTLKINDIGSTNSTTKKTSNTSINIVLTPNTTKNPASNISDASTENKEDICNKQSVYEIQTSTEANTAPNSSTSPTDELKIHLRKVQPSPELTPTRKRKKKRFRNLYSAETESSDENVSQISPDTKQDQNNQKEDNNIDNRAYSVICSGTMTGLPKIIIKRTNSENNSNSVVSRAVSEQSIKVTGDVDLGMQPVVRLVRNPRLDNLAKRKRKG